MTTISERFERWRRDCINPTESGEADEWALWHSYRAGKGEHWPIRYFLEKIAAAYGNPEVRRGVRYWAGITVTTTAGYSPAAPWWKKHRTEMSEPEKELFERQLEKARSFENEAIKGRE